MPAQRPSEDLSAAEEQQLGANHQWQLVQRIIASEGFERATQLRNLLRYLSRSALLHPEVVLREYDIARDVLGRRPDFDPSRDNIARAQVSHLRRKLDHYFNTEGKDEPIVLTIQKGSYTPIFRAAQASSRATEHAPSAGPTSPPAEPPAIPAVSYPQNRPHRRRAAIAATAVLSIGAVVAAFLVGRQSVAPSKQPETSHQNAFVRFLGRSQGNVTIVAPDLSLVLVRKMSGGDVGVADYTNPAYPEQELLSIKDPVIRQRVRTIARYPNTTLNEAMIGFDFKQAMQGLGVHSDIRFARTLHVEDLSQGNSLLIGGEGSNPWTSLFVDKMNFRFVEVNDHLHYFENAHPLPGEDSRYTVTYPSEAKIAVGYADIALTQNPTRTGYILLIDGSDLQASEAATRYLLHGKLSAEITSVLNREDLHYFEFLLRGSHVGQEAEDKVDLVAIRQ